MPSSIPWTRKRAAPPPTSIAGGPRASARAWGRWPACRSRSRTTSRRVASRPPVPRASSKASARLRRHRRRASRRGRRRHPREDQHGRVRDGLLERELGLRPDAEPVGPRRACRGARARARRRRWRRGSCPSRSAPTPAARCASRAPSAACSRSSPPTAACRATGSSPSPRRSIRSAPSHARPRTSCSGCTRSLDMTPGIRPRIRAAHRFAGPKLGDPPTLGVPHALLEDGLDADTGAIAEQAIERFRNLGMRIADVTLPRPEHALAAYYLARQCRSFGQSRALRRCPLWPAPGRRKQRQRGHGMDAHEPLRGDALRGLRTRGEAPDHARHLRALRGVLRCVLSPRPEGAERDPHRVLGPAFRRGCDSPSHVAHGGVPRWGKGPPIRSPCT